MYNVFCILDTYLIKFLILVYFKKIIKLHYIIYKILLVNGLIKK